MFLSKTKAVVFFLGLVFHQPCFAKKAQTRELAFPGNGSSVAALTSSIQSVYRQAEKIYLTVRREPFFILTPFNGIKADQEASFGLYADSKRIDLPENLANGNWQGISLKDDKIILFDGDFLRVAVFLQLDNTLISQYTMAWDMIRPPRDRNGEPTKMEIQKMRARFEKNYRHSTDTKIIGMSDAPDKWQSKGEVVFLTATSVADYPIVTIRCTSGQFSGCQFDRACNVEGYKVAFDTASGIAYSKKRNLVLLGDRKSHKIALFKANSCFDIRFVKELSLPSKLRPITGMQVDAEDRLWVATNGKDDYNNASVFTWDEKEW